MSERERERVCECVCVCVRERVSQSERKWKGDNYVSTRVRTPHKLGMKPMSRRVTLASLRTDLGPLGSG